MRGMMKPHIKKRSSKAPHSEATLRYQGLHDYTSSVAPRYQGMRYRKEKEMNEEMYNKMMQEFKDMLMKALSDAGYKVKENPDDSLVVMMSENMGPKIDLLRFFDGVLVRYGIQPDKWNEEAILFVNEIGQYAIAPEKIDAVEKMLSDYQRILEKTRIRIVGKAEEELLQYPIAEGLTALLYVDTDDCGVEGRVMLTKSMTEAWGASYNKDRLYEAALKNTSQTTVISRMEPNMAIVSDRDPFSGKIDNSVGNGGVLCSSIKMELEKILGCRTEDICLIPSSIHEFIATDISKMAMSFEESVKTLRLHVKEVNKSLMPKEIVSENIYKFSETGIKVA